MSSQIGEDLFELTENGNLDGVIKILGNNLQRINEKNRVC
jgi:hypothetical protein